MSAATDTPARTVIKTFPAAHPRGSWPAEEFADAQRQAGVPAGVVMDLDADAFLVVVNELAEVS